MQNNRSKHYDWFKGQGGKETKKTPKENLKTIWKILRIFLYLALFVFSMTGCVQIFIIKTDTKVGRGVEFYANESKIPPHVTNFEFKKGSYEDSTKATHDIYTINTSSKDNTWINDAAELKLIHDEIATQNKAKNLKMQDAFKGGNESFVISGEVTTPTPVGEVAKENGKPLIISSSSNIDASSHTVSIPFPKVYIVSGEVGKEKAVEVNWSALSNVANYKQEYAIKVAKYLLNVQIVDGNTTTTLKDWIQSSYAGINTTTTLTKDQVSLINHVFAPIANITNYLGIKISNKKGELGVASYIDKYTPGVGAGTTTYRPLVTWGDAWEEGPFYGMFVYPLAEITAKMLDSMSIMSGWETVITLFLVVWLMRAITFLLSFKSTLQQTKTQELAAKKAIIDAKYAPYKGNKQMENRQKQEVAELYKKNGINPLGAMGSIFITMPFFLSIWRVIGAIPHIKSTIWLGINFSATSYKELFAGEWQYLVIMILAVFFAVMQQLLPRLLTKKRDKHINVHQRQAMKKNNKTQNIMMAVFGFMALIMGAGIQMYWIAGGMWMMVQSYLTHIYLIKHKKKRRKKS